MKYDHTLSFRFPTMKTSLIGLGFLSLLIAQSASAANYRQGLGLQLFIEQMEEESAAMDAASTEMEEARDTQEDAIAESADEDITRLSDMIDADKVLTRAEFVTMIVDEQYAQWEIDRCFWDIASDLPPTFELVFTDVPVTNIYAKHICIAMRDGIVKGYRDGSFKPEQSINMAEASKILSRAYALAPFAEMDTTGSWFSPYLYALTVRNAVPASITSIRQELTAGELMEILTRLKNGITWEPSRSFDDFMPRPVAVVTRPTTTASSETASSASNSTPASNTRSSAAVSAASSVASVQTSSSKGAFWNPFD